MDLRVNARPFASDTIIPPSSLNVNRFGGREVIKLLPILCQNNLKIIWSSGF
jgi:hypothetical protein